MEQNKLDAPVKEGDRFKLVCFGIGKGGDGLFKYDNFVIIVPNARIAATYNIKVTKVMPKFAFGIIEDSSAY